MEIQVFGNMEKMVESIIMKEREQINKELSLKFGFKEEEGLEHLNREKLIVKTEKKRETNKTMKRETNKMKSSKIPLPFCGVKIDGCCEGIRLNHGLYTQCTNDPIDEDNNLCKTCNNQKDKNSNGEPTYGYIDNRIKLGDKFKDPKGKAPIKYGNIMNKLNITRNEAEREAANIGLVIPEDEFKVKKSQRGRPKKNTMANDTSGSDDDDDVASNKSDNLKKPRGRPKKESKTTINSGKDTLNSSSKELQQKTNKEKVKAKAKEEEKKEIAKEDYEEEDYEEEDEEEKDEEEKEKDEEEKDEEEEEEVEDELHVIEFKIKGKKYLKSADGNIFDIKTHEELGYYNKLTDEIEETEA